MTERFKNCKYIHHLMGEKMDESHCFADRKDGGAVRKVTEAETGSPCEVAPCGEKYGGSGIVRNTPANNPAIFVPELKKIVFGMESWWRILEKPEDLKGIAKEDHGYLICCLLHCGAAGSFPRIIRRHPVIRCGRA